MVSTTYGAGCTRKFIQGVHPEEKKIIADGIERCRDLLSVFVMENEAVKLGQRKSKKIHPVLANSKEVVVKFYITSNPNTKFTTDPGVTRIGSVTVQSPNTWKGRDRDVEVSMHFGGTEITATALDVSSGNKAQTTLDFSVDRRHLFSDFLRECTIFCRTFKWHEFLLERKRMELLLKFFDKMC